MAEAHDVPVFSTPFSSPKAGESEDELMTHENHAKLKSPERFALIYHLVFDIPENDGAFPETSDHQSVLTDFTSLVPE